MKSSLIQPYSTSDVLNPYGVQQPQQVAFQFWGKPVYQNSDGTYWCPGVEGKTIASNEWDVVFFATAPTPGVAEVTVEKTRSMDEKKPVGSDGARLTIHGTNPAKIEIKLLIWTPEQLRALNQLWPLLMVPPYKITTSKKTTYGFGTPVTTATVSGGSNATVSTVSIPTVKSQTTTTTKKSIITFDVSHPALAFHSIKSVQILGANGPMPGPIPGSRIFMIRAVEYLPPGKKAATTTDTAPLGSLYDPGAPGVSSYPTAGSNSSNTGPQ